MHFAILNDFIDSKKEYPKKANVFALSFKYPFFYSC